VLVVEDEGGVRDAILDILTTEGYRVAAAQDGRDALDMLRAGMRPSLILLDLRMPNLSGRDFLMALQQRPDLTAPIVVVSAHHDPPGHLADQRIDGYLRKPFSVDELMSVVSAYAKPDAHVPPSADQGSPLPSG
jgi:CheY-like chemotaxis protein